MRLVVPLFSLFIPSVFGIRPAYEAGLIAEAKTRYENVRQELCSQCLKICANSGLFGRIPQVRVDGNPSILNSIAEIIKVYVANGQTDPYKICSGITQQTLYLDLQDYMANFGVITSEFTTGWREPDLAELGEVRKRFQAAMEEWVRRYGKCRENDHNSGPTPNPKSPNEADSSRSAPDQQKPREAPPSKGANSIGLATGKKQTSGQQAVVGSGTSRSRNSVSTKQAAIKWRACMEPCMAGASDSPSIIGQLSTCMASSCGFPFKNVNPIKVAQRFYNSNQSDLEDQFKKAGMAAVVATILATIVAAILTAGAGAGAGALL